MKLAKLIQIYHQSDRDCLFSLFIFLKNQCCSFTFKRAREFVTRGSGRSKFQEFLIFNLNNKEAKIYSLIIIN